MKFLVGIILIVAPILSAADNYICTATNVTGFNTTGNWESVDFDAGQKYLVRRPAKDSVYKDHELVVMKFGEGNDLPIVACQNGFTDDGALFCDYLHDRHFQMRRDNGLFILTNVGGAVHRGTQLAEIYGPSQMTIGTCTPLP